MPFLTYPLALIAAAALPALVVIYWMQNRFRRKTVSSLLLWQDQLKPLRSGRRFQRLRTPLLFFLEILALLFLVAAAADPRYPTTKTERLLTAVLDDSASMSARDARGRSFRDQAVAALVRFCRRNKITGVQAIYAGLTPGIAGPNFPPARARAALAAWQPRAAGADLDAAVSLALAAGPPAGAVCVFTDHPPGPNAPVGGRVFWISVGRPLPNLGIVQAARSRGTTSDRCLIECRNGGAQTQHTLLRLLDAGGTVLARKTVKLAPGESARETFRLPPDTGPVEVRIGADALDLDNHVLLLPERLPKIRVRTTLRPGPLHDLVLNALDATGLRAPGNSPPDLSITDAPPLRPLSAPAWELRLLQPAKSQAFVGPFILDRRHPLCRGLELNGVIWAAAKRDIAGNELPVIMAGNVPLLVEQDLPGGGRRLTLTFDPKASNLQNTPNWPVLFWNLLAWRGRNLPGFRQHQVRLGRELVFLPPPGTRQVQIRGLGPKIKTFTLQPGQDRLLLAPKRLGLIVARAKNFSDRCACNLLAPHETDLSRCKPGTWGRAALRNLHKKTMAGLDWLFALFAAGVLAVHGSLIARRKTS